jgi:Tfp pilus assembly protein PilO
VTPKSQTTTKVVGGLALILLVAGGWLFVLGPETSSLADVQAETVDTQDRNVLLARQVADLRKQEQHLDETRATALALGRIFPPTADQPGLFEMVTRAAQAAGISAGDVTALTPTPPTTGQTDPAGGVGISPTGTDQVLAQQTVSLSVEGTYEETTRLLSNLEAMQRAYLVGTVTLAGGTDGDTFTTTITGQMFVMAPVEYSGGAG